LNLFQVKLYVLRCSTRTAKIIIIAHFMTIEISRERAELAMTGTEAAGEVILYYQRLNAKIPEKIQRSSHLSY